MQTHQAGGIHSFSFVSCAAHRCRVSFAYLAGDVWASSAIRGRHDCRHHGLSMKEPLLASRQMQLLISFLSHFADNIRRIWQGTPCSPRSDTVRDGNRLFHRLSPVVAGLCCLEALVLLHSQDDDLRFPVPLHDDCLAAFSDTPE